MKQAKNVTYLMIAIAVLIISVVVIYFAAQHDKNTAPENSAILNHYETKDSLIAKLEKQKLFIDKQESKLILLNDEVNDLRHKNKLVSIELVSKDKEIEDHKKKLEQQKTLDVFECKKPTTGTNNLEVALNCINTFKVILTENYQATGQFPTDLSDLNLKLLPSENELIQEISFGIDGSPNFYLHSSFGENKKLTLTPEITQTGMVRFSCRTNLKQNELLNNYCTIE